MIKKTSSILMIGIAALGLLGCSKQPAPAPAAPATEVDDKMTDEAASPRQEKPKENTAEKATKLLGYIQDKPECQQFKTALEQAQAPGGESANLEQVMSDAYKAGCSK
jgi:PBP1b-binding outer membrane lipoprotein LpoB